MVVKSLKFVFLFTIGLIAMQLLFRSEINWLDIIGMSFMAFLFHILFESVDKREKKDI